MDAGFRERGVELLMGDEKWWERLGLFMEGEVVAERAEHYCGDTSWGGGDVWGHWSIKGFSRELRLTAVCEEASGEAAMVLGVEWEAGQGWEACDHSGTLGRSVVEELDSLWDVKGSHGRSSC